jgi:alpha-mannosidase
MEFYTISKSRQDHEEECIDFGEREVPAFSWVALPLDGLGIDPTFRTTSFTDTYIESPFFRLEFDPATGRIQSLWDRTHSWQVLDDTCEYSFFQYVQETIDGTQDAVSRTAYFEDGKGWIPSWPSSRKGPSRLVGCRSANDGRDVVLVLEWEAPGVRFLEQRITLYGSRPAIGLSLRFDKEDIRTPEGIYLAFPLHLEEWQCHYDTAGLSVALDDGQLPGACRDWLTVDRTVSVHDRHRGVTLACPDAPMVQVGGFRFGRKSATIERNPNPLLLAWPMNNYWDTNFPARQPGLHRIDYELSTFSTFDPVEAFRAGIAASDSMQFAAVVSCPVASQGRLIEITGEGVLPLYVKPSRNGKEIVLTVRNTQDVPTLLHCAVPGRDLFRAVLVDALEQDLNELTIEAGQLSHWMPQGALQWIRVLLR